MGQQTRQLIWLGEALSAELLDCPALRQLNDFMILGLPVMPGIIVGDSSQLSLEALMAAHDRLLHLAAAPALVAEVFTASSDRPTLLSGHLKDWESVEKVVKQWMKKTQTDRSWLLLRPLSVIQQSGVMSTGKQLVITAAYGRPEPLYEGLLTGDVYTVDLDGLTILARDINRQTWQLTNLSKSSKHHKVSVMDQSSQKLDDEQIMELAKLATILTHQTDFSYQLDWFIDDHNKLWVAGARQSLGTSTVAQAPQASQIATLCGKGVAGFRAMGPVRQIHHRRETAQVVPGEIVLAETPDLMNKSILAVAGGYIFEAGQATHPFIKAAIETGHPVIVGATGALQRLPDGLLVTINGATGAIYQGKKLDLADESASALVTGTKLYAHIDDFAQLNDLASTQTDGVGLLSAMALFKEIGQHPRHFIKTEQSKLFITQLTDLLQEALTLAAPHPVFYVLSDGQVHEYKDLRQGDSHELDEAQAVIGYRGAHRSLQELDILRAELAAIRQLRDSENISHLHLLLPFVRTVDEFCSVRQLIINAGLRPGRDLKLGLVAQTPASLLMAEELIDNDFLQTICLDLDSLGQLLLGFDMNNPRFQGEYTLTDPGVMRFLGQAIHQIRSAGIPVTVSGKVLHDRPELIEWFVQVGITGLVLDPDLLVQTRRLIASAEQRLLLDHALI